jgi:UDP-N-acetylglucosamine 2-epimerase (non-hydrolysing)
VVLSSIRVVIDEHKQGSYKRIAEDYTVENTSWRVLKLIMGNARLSNKWWGINK